MYIAVFLVVYFLFLVMMFRFAMSNYGSYICFASFCNLVLANTFTITYQVHITMCHPYLTTGTLNSAQTHRLSR